MKITIIVAEFNKDITDRLLDGAITYLNEHKKEVTWDIVHVPGAFELPYMAQRVIAEKKSDGVIALGCVLKGETDHYQAVCDGVTYGLQKVAIENRVPVMFGVLMCNSKDLALARSALGSRNNKGYECAEGLLALLKAL